MKVYLDTNMFYFLLIIGQAISDRVLLVSSDHKFEHYVKYGLNFIFNKR